MRGIFSTVDKMKKGNKVFRAIFFHKKLMDTSSKNVLQEHCMRKKLSLPNYRIRQQLGPPHALKFQVII